MKMIRTRGRRENEETAKAVRGRTKEERRVGRMRNIKHFTFFIRQVSAPVPSLNQRDQTYKKERRRVLVRSRFGSISEEDEGPRQGQAAMSVQPPLIDKAIKFSMCLYLGSLRR